jgi:hypothetical protein
VTGGGGGGDGAVTKVVADETRTGNRAGRVVAALAMRGPPEYPKAYHRIGIRRRGRILTVSRGPVLLYCRHHLRQVHRLAVAVSTAGGTLGDQERQSGVGVALG